MKQRTNSVLTFRKQKSPCKFEGFYLCFRRAREHLKHGVGICIDLGLVFRGLARQAEGPVLLNLE